MMNTQPQQQRRTLIIGDIHGCYEELLDLFDAAALGAEDVVVSVGDLVDRGPKPAEVVKWFRERPSHSSIVLMGNHERKHVRNVLSYSQEITRVQFPSADAYADAVEWMKHLPYYWEIPGIVRVVHAALVPGVPLAEQDDAILSGTTSGEKKLSQLFPEGYWHERYSDDVPVVFGHHVTGPEPLVREGKVYGIDTGCCHGHRLTALSVPDFKLYSVPSRGGDYWKQTMRDYQVPVLRTRAWSTMSWAKIKAELDDHRDESVGFEATGYVAKIGAWAEGIRELIPKLLDRVPVLYEELGRDDAGATATRGSAAFAAALEAHPAKPLLFLWQRKKLTLDAVKTRCTTPQTTLDLAKKLGIDTSSFVLP
jgi:serine/threonine protein phosphatase 1